MDRIEQLVRSAYEGDEQSILALVAIFKPDILAMSRKTDRPKDTFDTLVSEFVLDIRSGLLLKNICAYKS